MNLIDAAQLIERLQMRAAHEGELKALKIARDALLTIVSEGFSTLDDRLGRRTIDSTEATTPQTTFS